MRRLVQFVMGAAWLLSMTLVYAAPPPVRIWVALAESGGPYAETAAVLKAELAQEATLAIARWQTLLDEKAESPDLIITVGVGAFEGALKWLATRDDSWSRVPVLASLLPRAAYDAQLNEWRAVRRPLSAAVLDQPVARQMALLKRALPERRRVGVLPGPQTRPLLDMLGKEVRAAGLQLVVAPEVSGPDALYPALKDVLDTADVILAWPEPTVYHGASLQNILLTTYRAGVPLVAFSPAYVKAGAVLALYSTPAQVARQAAEMVRIWQNTRVLPSPQMPREFAVLANPRVAASLGLQIDEADVLAEDLRRMEGER